MTPETFRHDILSWIRMAMPHARTLGRAFVLGINGPQGAGKTTLARFLETSFAALAQPAVAVSIDDFYLTRAEQVALAAAHPHNRYLQQRGYPGTHDVALGERTLAALSRLQPGETLRLPVYDKSAHGGLGDRLPNDQWRLVTGPIEVVIVEGWMLGFVPVRPEDPLLAEVDALLPAYAAWTRRLDAMVQLVAADPSYVVAWRAEAEANARASGKPGLSDTAIRAYTQLFLPAYRLWPQALAAHPPAPRWHRVEVLGPDRLPQAQ